MPDENKMEGFLFERLRSSDRVPFSYLVTKQLERINDNESKMNMMFVSAVSSLEGLMRPYVDSDYKDRRKEIMKEVNRLKLEMPVKLSLSKAFAIEWEKARAIKQLLLELMAKQGLLPDRRTTAQEGSAEWEDEKELNEAEKAD